MNFPSSAPTLDDLATSKIDQVLRTHGELKLELGAGAVAGKDGWLTVDLADGADIKWDVNQGLPFRDSSVARIYSSHFLEHHFFNDLLRLLIDCRRILIPGGCFDCCVPDASIFLRAYFDPKSFDQRIYFHTPAVISNMKMDLVNYIAYMGGAHRHMFDGQNLQGVLAAAGFVSISLREFAAPRDMEAHRYESVYALGYKPAF